MVPGWGIIDYSLAGELRNMRYTQIIQWIFKRFI